MPTDDNQKLRKFIQGQDAPGPIKLDCEVQSSGITPPNATFRDDPDFFPELKLKTLRAQAELWGDDFLLIERIILYRGVFDPRYVLAVEFRDYETLEKERKFWPWQPDNLEALLEMDYKRAFGDLKNWIIYPRAPGEEIIEVRENCCWLLYARNPEIPLNRIVDEPQERKAEIERLRSERESDEEGKIKACMLLRNKYREDHIEGSQLIKRWGLCRHELSNCLILGLQGYDVNPFSGDLGAVGSSGFITSRMEQEARQFFQKRSGAKPTDYPLKFQAQRGKNDFPFRDIPFRFVAGEVPDEYKTEEDVNKAHMRLLFRLDDVEKFGKQYGLYDENVAGTPEPEAGAAPEAEVEAHDTKLEAEDVTPAPLDKADKFDFSFFKNGDFWAVGVYGKELSFKDIKGMAYIHFLLTGPNEIISPAEVYNLKVDRAENVRGNRVCSERTIDVKSMKAAREALEELKEEYEETDDPEKRQLQEEKIELYESYLNRYRRTVHTKEEESVRTSVQKRIKAALEKINKEASGITEELKYLSTGYTLSYTGQAKWKLFK